MFLQCRSWYTAGGEQRARGSFLLMMCSDTRGDAGRELRAVVASVEMRQCGHFMMSAVQIGAVRLGLSGAYGSDGLPVTIATGDDADPRLTALWRRAVPLPPDLTRAFWSGGGHNAPGAEAPSLRSWAAQNLAALRLAWRRARRDAAAAPLPVRYRGQYAYGMTVADGTFREEGRGTPIEGLTATAAWLRAQHSVANARERFFVEPLF